MIEFNYKIVRNEGDKEEKYTPIIPRKLEDLTCIEGPNSVGKSTLLHILAISFFGLKKRKLHPFLRSKMNDLMDSNYQELTFEIKIKNKKNNLEIISKKENPNNKEWIIYEIINGKKIPLSFEKFEDEYNLIYDIPDDPTQRLKDLTHELEDRQHQIGNRVIRLSSFIRNVITEIKNARDPKKIVEFKEQVKSLKKELEDKKKEKLLYENDLIFLEKYYTCKSCLDYKERIEEVKNKIEALEDKIKSSKKEKRTVKKEEEKLVAESREIIRHLESKLGGARVLLKKLLSKETNFLNVWDRMDLQEVLLESDDDNNLVHGIAHFRKKLLEREESEIDRNKFREANLYSQLINILKKFIDTKIIIPCVEKTVPEFINILEKKFKEYENLKILHENIETTLQLLREIDEQRNKFVKEYTPRVRKILIDYKKRGPVKVSPIDDVQSRLEELNKELVYCQKKYVFHKNECIKKNIDEDKIEITVNELEKNKELASYFSYTESQLNRVVTGLKKSICDKEDEIRKINYRISTDEYEIETLEKKEPHKYQDYLEELKELHDKIQNLEEKICKEFSQYLQELIDEKVRDGKLTDLQNEYYNQVAHYLGRKVGVIRHVDKEYKVDKIDLVSGKIYTISKKIIKLTDMGTGQSQSAYLKGLLNPGDDKRKMIALIDEVAMMDSRSMKPIYEILRNQYEKGNLLIGIVVQKSENIAVKPIS